MHDGCKGGQGRSDEDISALGAALTWLVTATFCGAIVWALLAATGLFC